MLDAQEFVDLVAHVNRHADGASLVGDGAGDGLADPPRCVGGEFMSAAVVKLLRGADQADVAFLDQVKERHAAPHVFLGDGDHKARVGGNEVFARRPAVFDEAAQFQSAFGRDAAMRQFFARGTPALDALRQLNFFGGGQQRDAADLFEVQADGVVGVYVGEVIVQREIGLGFGFAALFHRDQFVLGGLGHQAFFHKGDAGA